LGCRSIAARSARHCDPLAAGAVVAAPDDEARNAISSHITTNIGRMPPKADNNNAACGLRRHDPWPMAAWPLGVGLGVGLSRTTGGQVPGPAQQEMRVLR